MNKPIDWNGILLKIAAFFVVVVLPAYGKIYVQSHFEAVMHEIKVLRTELKPIIKYYENEHDHRPHIRER